jgi:hypothetical protein
VPGQFAVLADHAVIGAGEVEGDACHVAQGWQRISAAAWSCADPLGGASLSFTS